MSDPQLRRRHAQRWVWQILALAGLVGAVLAGVWLASLLPAYFHQSLNDQNAQAGVVSMFTGAAALLVSIAALIVAMLQLRQRSRSAKPVEQLAPDERRERDVRDRLRRLKRMDDPDTRAWSLRVHRAIDLPPAAASRAAASPAARRRQRGWRRLLPRAGHGRPSDARPLDQYLPTFVNRDKGPKIRDWMCSARDEGGFLLLVGQSCVGKTRLLYEAAREVLGDFALLAPDLGAGDRVNEITAAALPKPGLIVWLDELQRFLDGPYLNPGSIPITDATICRLLAAPTPVIILGTLWPKYLTQLQLRETDPDRKQPCFPNAVDVLNPDRMHKECLDKFSPAERQAAAELASEDPRLDEALAYPNYHVTAALAGAPRLMDRYKEADEEQKAVLHAAIDAHRLGIHAPLTEQLLAAAARGYLTTVHPDDTWFPPALAELITYERPEDRATAPLIRERSPNNYPVLGYTVADYLLQNVSAARRSQRLPAVTWQALIDHTRHRGDRVRLAVSADHRLLYRYAETLYRPFANTGDTYAAHRLADLLVKRKAPDDDVTAVFQILIEGVTSERDISDKSYYDRLFVNGETCGSIVARLDKQGRQEAAMAIRRAWADAGYRDAAEEWAKLLIEQDRTDQAVPIARTLVDIRLSHDARWWLRRLLIEQDQTNKAMTVLRAFTDAGGTNAANQLAAELGSDLRTHRVKPFLFGSEYIVEGWFDRFVDQGRADEALTVLRALTNAGSWHAASMLADLLAEQGDEDALAELRTRADAEKELDFTFTLQRFDRRLADLLAARDNIQELQVRADAGSWPAACWLADLLVDRGNIDELRARADAGDEAAGDRLARLLVDHDDIEGMRTRANAGDRNAAERLARLLVEQDHIDEAITIVRTLAAASDWPAKWLVTLVREQGNTQEAITLLRARADGGDEYAAADWAELLIEQDRTDQAIPIAKALVDTNRQSIAFEWCNRLAEQGRTDEVLTVLRALADAGDSFAADQLVDTLIAENCTEDALGLLRARADTGDNEATDRLAQLLIQQDHLDELRARADAGDMNAAGRLADLLAERGRLDELRERADAHDWDWCAAGRLADLLVKHGRLEELQRRADAGDDSAASRLAELLAEQGRLEELRHRADVGDSRAAERLTDLLARDGRLDELRDEVDAGTPDAGARLIGLLDRIGETEQAERIRSFGLNPDGSIADGDPGS